MNARLLTALIALATAPISLAQIPLATIPATPLASETAIQDQVLTELTRQLTERYQIRGELQLEWVRAFSPSTPPTGPLEIAILSSPSKLASSLLLQVRVGSAGRHLGDYTLSLRAQLLREVWAARVPLERGTDFDPTQLDIRRLDVFQQRDALAIDDIEKTELTYAISVPAGRVLTWRDVARRALVRKGQVVDVTAIDGSLTITTKALALENGAEGDTVKLRNLESKKDFSARVIAAARAQVRF